MAKKKRRWKRIVIVAVIAIVLIKGLAVGGTEHADTKHGWQLVLVNKTYAMPHFWWVRTLELTNGQVVDKRMYPALQAMFDAARAEGLAPEVTSGYRSGREQRKLIRQKKADLRDNGLSWWQARKEVTRWVAEAGHSEHQTGLAVDINDGRGQSSQALYGWLAQNAWRYGFIQRYPANHLACTGTAHEPWHYRYVGKEAAAEIYQRGLCLEEYVAQLNT